MFDFSGDKKMFHFDKFYNGSEIGEYVETLAPVLNAFLLGKSGCVMAHGQTGNIRFNENLSQILKHITNFK